MLGELACTVADDGAFSLTPGMLATLDGNIDDNERAGVVLAMARLSEGTVELEDALTFNGKRVSITPARTRVADITWTRVSMP